MDKRRINIAVKVIREVKTEYPQTTKFVDDLLEQECRKGNMSVGEIIFLLTYLDTFLNIFYFVVLVFKAERFSLHLTKYTKRYSIRYLDLDIV